MEALWRWLAHNQVCDLGLASFHFPKLGWDRSTNCPNSDRILVVSYVERIHGGLNIQHYGGRTDLTRICCSQV